MIKKHEAFLLFSVGVMIALSSTVNSMVAGIVNPILGSITGGKGQYI